MKATTVASISEQIRLCEQAAASFKTYHEAKGVVPPQELEKLRLQAEFHYATINDYLLRCRQGIHGDNH
ncbi:MULTISPECIES: hypothetical protein [Pseudomonas]|uniref:hypothetical protein n=1 Tax=Pseudomonas TaxID=286 RepID=UPI0011822BFE|nr:MULTISPECIES: hypothetical protein [Pseudomonas]MCX9136010.1 hypothetical protein [Pseudomonas sp. DCB_PUT]MDD1971932.1 hypothetical protein [Pseudomonas putida]MDO1464102.1 hypothetical protein [Pseudomonas putida]MDO1469479.1 hypothetical protein [Pseudomonas putida]MDZ7326955.1 hypothetical protein [Pseudomonas sp. SDS3-8]